MPTNVDPANGAWPMRRGRAPTYASTWLVALPRRWALNGGALGLAFGIALVGLAPMPGGTALNAGYAIAIGISSYLTWFLLGYWARWSLRAKHQLSPASALTSIRDNWLNGAVIIAGAPILLRRMTVELGLIPNDISFRDDFIQGLAALSVCAIVASAVAVVSSYGLRRQIAKDGLADR